MNDLQSTRIYDLQFDNHLCREKENYVQNVNSASHKKVCLCGATPYWLLPMKSTLIQLYATHRTQQAQITDKLLRYASGEHR